MNKLTLTLGLLTMLGSAAFAQSTSDPVLDLSINGSTAGTATLTEDSSANAWMIGGTGTFTANDGTKIYNGGTNGTLLTFDPDPSINFGFGVFNGSGTTETVTLSFPQQYGSPALPVTLPPGTYQTTASLALTLSESDGNAASLTQNGTMPFLEGLLNQGDTLNQTDVINTGTGSLTIPAGESGTQSTGETFPTLVDSNYSLATTGTTMSVQISFLLSPNDSASFSGTYSINAVPEPKGLGLGLLAMAGFCVLAWRCGKARA